MLYVCVFIYVYNVLLLLLASIYKAKKITNKCALMRGLIKFIVIHCVQQLYIKIHIHIHMLINIYIPIHIYIHTYTCTHTHIYIQ